MMQALDIHAQLQVARVHAPRTDCTWTHGGELLSLGRVYAAEVTRRGAAM